MNICIIEDEDILRITLRDELREKKHEVKDFNSPVQAMNYITTNQVDLVISDIKLPFMSGLEVLEKLKEIKPELTIILMTAYGNISHAISAIKKGAYDYLLKPFELDDLLNKINNVSITSNLKKESKILRSQIFSKYDFTNYIGEGRYVTELRQTLKIVSETDSSVLITGETGTGKELVAGIIHYNSTRKLKPFVKVSCAILARELFESELFGHEKGSFTGALKERIGRFELADTGTIYLDDIDDVPLDLQVKLLRVLQEREIEKIGSSKPVKIDVRIIASTKYDLRKMVSDGKFREDLYYRLNVLPVELKPLRAHKEDIPILCNYFIRDFTGGNNIMADPETLSALEKYDWPGNIREFRNVMERMILFARENKISPSMVPAEKKANNFFLEDDDINSRPLNDLLKDIEIMAINSAMKKADYNKNRAAEILQIPASTLKSKIEKLDLSFRD
jgi:DNA-binding NtrC family response regulator